MLGHTYWVSFSGLYSPVDDRKRYPGSETCLSRFYAQPERLSVMAWAEYALSIPRPVVAGGFKLTVKLGFGEAETSLCCLSISSSSPTACPEI